MGRAGRGADLSVRGRVCGLSVWCVGGRLPRGACLSARGDAGGSCPGGVTLSVEGGSDAQLLALRYCGFCWAGLSARAGWELGRGAGLRRERWKEELGWFVVGLGLVLVFFLFLFLFFSFLNLIQTNSNQMNSNLNLNSLEHSNN